MYYNTSSQAWRRLYNEYAARVAVDGGSVRGDVDMLSILKNLSDTGRLDQVKLLWYGGSGVKLRTSGVNSFVSKAYSVQLPANDLAQTTELSQPWQSGNIAPNEKPCLLNPQSGVRTIEHPAINFANNVAWSVTTMVNWSGTNEPYAFYVGTKLNYGLLLRLFTNVVAIREYTSGAYKSGTKNTSSLIGKNSVISFTCDNAGNLSYYFNGIFQETLSGIDTQAAFFGIMKYGSSFNYHGKYYYHLIQSGALTASQVAGEYNTLRGLIPEIETVLIGSKYIASSNLDVVSSANGTVIADGTLTANWTPGTAAWCYPKDATPSEVYLGGKLYNKAARNVIIANPPAGYHVATEAELTALAALGSNALKLDGTTYWATTGGTNTTGFTALAMASRKADGSFNTYKNTASFWCADSDKVLVLSHDSNTASVEAVASVNDGHSIRLIKD